MKDELTTFPRNGKRGKWESASEKLMMINGLKWPTKKKEKEKEKEKEKIRRKG